MIRVSNKLKEEYDLVGCKVGRIKGGGYGWNEGKFRSSEGKVKIWTEFFSFFFFFAVFYFCGFIWVK